MANLLQLTAYKVGPSNAELKTPQIFTLQETDLGNPIQKRKTGTFGSVLKLFRNSQKVEVFETVLQIDTQLNPSKAGADINAAVAGAGSVQGTATLLTKYMNIVTSATGGSAEGVRLGAATRGKVVRIVNNTAVTVKVYPATGENINALADNIALDLPAGATYHYACLTAGFWKSIVIN
jgi:hypothetical protein